ncbi:MAG: hypothetical protein LBU65_04350 [Planctomycetaceae bacterium]|jgi:hypothetical protein|nr:hypothetical protein [Planctomycetaceae bacterium]
MYSANHIETYNQIISDLTSDNQTEIADFLANAITGAFSGTETCAMMIAALRNIQNSNVISNEITKKINDLIVDINAKLR